MAEARYVHLGDGDWWVASGRWQYVTPGESVAAARDRFFAPIAHLDALGARTTIGCFGTYCPLRNATEDAAHNRTTIDAFDLRALAPVQMTDLNGNISELLLDELGWVKATAVRGKGAEGDDLSRLSIVPSPADTAAHNAVLTPPTSVELDLPARTLLQHASARFVYDPHRYVTSGGGEPPVSASILREQHTSVLANSPVQISFE